jgi:hypothetical protein
VENNVPKGAKLPFAADGSENNRNIHQKPPASNDKKYVIFIGCRFRIGFPSSLVYISSLWPACD